MKRSASEGACTVLTAAEIGETMVAEGLMLHYRLISSLYGTRCLCLKPNQVMEKFLIKCRRRQIFLEDCEIPPHRFYPFECSTWTILWVYIDNLLEYWLACGHCVCPHAELLTFGLSLGQPVTCLHLVQSCVNY